MSKLSFLTRVRPKALIVDSATQWSRQRASSKAAALAMYMIFSLAPILILVIAVTGMFFGKDAAQAQLVDQLRDLMGDRGAEVIQIVLASAYESKGGWIAALLSIAVLMFSATTAFNELKQSLDELWDVDTSQQGSIRNLMQARLRAFGLVVVLALFLLLSLTVSAALAALRSYYGDLWSDSTFAAVADFVSRAFSFSVVVALFAVVFKLLPGSGVPWLHVIPGAVVTTGLFLIGKWGIGLYLGHGGVASAYGAAGSVVALLLWIYYSALIFFFGAVLTRQYALQVADATPPAGDNATPEPAADSSAAASPPRAADAAPATLPGQPVSTGVHPDPARSHSDS